MGGESPNQVTTRVRAVFLSYASQDAEAARRIFDALRAAGIVVWFDQSELRGGDAWDRQIRKQIHDCTLFMPIISKNTHERAEGYFRLEWNLAVDRCQRMSADKAFLIPVDIDDTPDDDERVPEKFRDVQWTQLPAGKTPPEFITRILQLLSPESGHSPTIALGRISEKSIAVLPFTNLSAEKESEYFSDGLAEEILNALSQVAELRVAARSSSFSFKGKATDAGEIARRLHVAHVLEGSVRRAGERLRITVQLVDARKGFQLWSERYDRNINLQ
jgi:TolB-like protein